jgi:hypothetical protein
MALVAVGVARAAAAGSLEAAWAAVGAGVAALGGAGVGFEHPARTTAPAAASRRRINIGSVL